MLLNPSRVPLYSDVMLVHCGIEVGWSVLPRDFTGLMAALMMGGCNCCLVEHSGRLTWLVERKGFPDIVIYEVAMFEAMPSTSSVDACIVFDGSALLCLV